MTTLEAPVQTKPQPFRHPHQVFEYLFHAWDIAKLIKALDDGEIKPHRDEFPREFIEHYAQSVLGLHPDQKTRGMGFIHVNLDKALALPPAALEEPVIVLQTAKNKGMLRMEGFDNTCHLLADGQHRIAKAFYEKALSIPVYVLNLKDSNKFKLHK